MKIMFSAGEASGDTHAASVARALREQYPTVEMIGMGGQKMAEAGVRIVYDIDQLGFIGIVEILKALPKFFKLRSYLKQVMLKEKPDVFVCVDYPGFNMKMAKVAHSLGIPVVYYICPTIWAWHRSRGYDIAKYTTKIASIFPFEAKAYEEFGVDVTFVGHPLLDIVQPTMTREEAMQRFGADPDAFRIMLMPGSRLQEVKGLLPGMLEAMKELSSAYPAVQLFLPRAHTIPKALLTELMAGYELPITVTEGNTYDVMQVCDAAIAASGTATLETALMGVPTILVYRVAPLTYAIGKRVIRIPYVGLPNIVADKEIIPELIQDAVTPHNMALAMERLISDATYYTQMKQELAGVKSALGEPGAVGRVAQLIASVASSEDAHEKL